MRIAVLAVRTLLGLLFLFASISFLFKLLPPPELTGDMKTFNAGMEASGYLLYLVKGVELACGLALVSGRFVPLAALLLAPISVNILCVHMFLEPQGLPVAILVVLGNLFLGYTYRKQYQPLLVAR